MAEGTRFVTYDDEHLQDLLKANISKNIGFATKTALTLLNSFCAQTDQNVDLTKISVVNWIKFYKGFMLGYVSQMMNFIKRPQ